MPASDMTGVKAPGRQTWRIEVWSKVSGTPTLDRTWTPASPGPLKGSMEFEWNSCGACVSAQLTVDTDLGWEQFKWGIRAYFGSVTEPWAGLLMDDPDGKRTPSDKTYTVNFQGMQVVNADGLYSYGWDTASGWASTPATYLSVPSPQRGDTWASYLARGTATDGLASWGVRGNGKTVAARPSDGVRVTVDVSELREITSTGRVTAPYTTETVSDQGQPWAVLTAQRSRDSWTPRKAQSASSDGLQNQSVSHLSPFTGTDPSPNQLYNQASGWISRVYYMIPTASGSSKNPTNTNAGYENISFKQRMSIYLSASAATGDVATGYFVIFLSTSSTLNSAAIKGEGDTYRHGNLYFDPSGDTNIIQSSVKIEGIKNDVAGGGQSYVFSADDDVLNTVRSDINGGVYYLHFGMVVNSSVPAGGATSTNPARNPSTSYAVIYANELTQNVLASSIPTANLPAGWNMPFTAGPTWQAKYAGLLVPPFNATNMPVPGGGTATPDGANAKLVISQSEFSTLLQIGALPWGGGG